jgi:dihydrofolate reductase
MRVSVFVAASLDGFIARVDGGVDWLGAVEVAGEDYGFHAFLESVDAIAMGRNTYEAVLSFGGAWPFGPRPVIVLTHRPLRPPGEARALVEAVAAAPADLARRLEARGLRHLYVDGGQVIQAFLREGLVDRLIVSRIPVLLGSGIPLFGELRREQRLRHVATRAYASGLVQSDYALTLPPGAGVAT